MDTRSDSSDDQQLSDATEQGAPSGDGGRHDARAASEPPHKLVCPFCAKIVTVDRMPELIANEEARQRVASEAVELGRALFRAVLTVAAGSASEHPYGAADFPVEDLRTAGDQVFDTLRLLLDAS
jgi:hypothetical protein